jgi:hypothetical protein
VERKKFIERLQQYAREKSVRVSFLGGDVKYKIIRVVFKPDNISHRFIVVVLVNCIQKI